MKNAVVQKTISFCCLLLILFFVSCKKNNLLNEQNTFHNADENLKVAQEVPPEILQSMYSDYLKNNELQKARNIKSAYDFKTGKRIAESSLNLNLYQPGVGYVLDGGYFIESSGSAQAHIEKFRMGDI